MPNPNNIAMLVSGPPEPRIESINQARLKGFTDFFFYPDAAAARQASYEHCVRDEKLRTVVFDEIIQVGGQAFVLHVLGMTPRPKPEIKAEYQKRSRFNDAMNRPTCPPRTRIIGGVPFDAPTERQYSPDGKTFRARKIVEVDTWKQPNSKLNAFAVFMGEWAGKIKKAATR